MPSLLEGMGRLLKVVFGLLAITVTGIVIGAGLLYYHFTKDLPKVTNIGDYRPQVVSEVFADDGTKIGEFWQECRFLLPYDKIPRRAVDAFVASEDERFWDHKGVDFKSIARAFIENLKAGHRVQGGSTITQQVTRALLLSREKSFGRKIREAILATQIEQTLTKEQILYIYLNQIFLGNRSYGIAAAARNYFHKDLKDLSLAELTMIAGLPSAPTTYSPLSNPTMAKVRQQHVLDRMLENGYIKKSEHDEALTVPLTLYRAGTDKDFNYRYAPYFVETIRRMVEESYGQETLNTGGLKIYTTASLAGNQAADRAVKRGLLEVERRKGFHGPVPVIDKDKIGEFTEAVHRELAEFDEPFYLPANPNIPPMTTPLENYHIYRGVITAMDDKGVATVKVGRVDGTISPEQRRWIGRTPKIGEAYWVRKTTEGEFTIEVEPKLESSLFSYNPLTGEVKAISGGFSFKKSEFNRATQAVRQPGSSFKPIVYTSALDKGYTPKTVIVDAPVSYQIGRNTFWSPKNYSNKYNGPITVRNAIAHSINVVAVKILHDVGIDYMVGMARKLGLTTPIPKYLSTALGAADVTLQELARAYGTFPAGGVRPELLFITKITDKDGNVVLEKKPYNIPVENAFTGADPFKDVGIHVDLGAEAEKYIQQDKLKLTEEERKILFGDEIPPGHVLTPQTAYIMVSLMRGVVDYGTGFKAKELKRPAAGKTGTTNDESDAWFMGYVPNMVTGVWLGYDSRKKIGPGMTGGVVSAPIWLYYMQDVLKDTPVLNFSSPPDIKVANIDDLSGGSSQPEAKPEPEDLQVPTGNAPASRGVDFLYNDLNKL